MECHKQLQIYNFQNCPVRVLERDGETLWIAKDACRALGIEEGRNIVNRLDDDERVSVLVDTPGGAQEMNAVNEPGLYSLILRSRKPQAKAFKRWVTHEVLPSIRRTGSYSVNGGEQVNALADRLAILEEDVRRLRLRQLAAANAKRPPSDTPKQPPYVKVIYTRLSAAIRPELQEYIAEQIPFEHGDRAKLYEEIKGKNGSPMSQATFYRLCRSLEKILCNPESQERSAIKPD